MKIAYNVIFIKQKKYIKTSIIYTDNQTALFWVQSLSNKKLKKHILKYFIPWIHRLQPIEVAVKFNLISVNHNIKQKN